VVDLFISFGTKLFPFLIFIITTFAFDCGILCSKKGLLNYLRTWYGLVAKWGNFLGAKTKVSFINQKIVTILFICLSITYNTYVILWSLQLNRKPLKWDLFINRHLPLENYN
jgi:hypothetical protein